MRATKKMSTRHRPRIVSGFFGWLWLFVTIIPIYYIIVTSLRPREDYYKEGAFAIPGDPSLRAYNEVIQNDFGLYLGNSLFVTVITVAVTLTICVMASFVIIRRRTRGITRTFRFFLLGIAIPIQATIVPVYLMIVQLGLYDTLWALIFPSVGFAIPITILILTNFMRDIPRELFESMTVDGATNMQILRRLVLPMSAPALITVGIYDALNVWNGFLFPLILTQSSGKRVLPLSLWTYQGEFTADVPAILAAVVLSVIPLFVAYVIGRRQMVAGLTAGFGK
ncbi:carbohydrate ABC transporter permease [Schaalia turicensis]|uniref:carbohydrate ABC transporter permease n=1 Tax=Schaalia turicensis TaxID=131111 RepID=UPI0036A0EE21